MNDNRKQRISPRLIKKLGLLLAMALIFLALAIWHLVTDFSEWRWALIGLGLGFAMGIALTMFDRYVWHEGDERVVSTSNIFGTVMLVLYVIFSIEKNDILDDWITNPNALGMTTAWLSFGVMLVRVQRMRREMEAVIRAQFGIGN